MSIQPLTFTANEDWLRTLAWDLPPSTWDEWVEWVGGDAGLHEWLLRPALEAAPASIADGYKAWGQEHGYDASLFARIGINGEPAARTAEFDESKVTRDERGRFSSDGASGEPEGDARGGFQEFVVAATEEQMSTGDERVAKYGDSYPQLEASAAAIFPNAQVVIDRDTPWDAVTATLEGADRMAAQFPEVAGSIELFHICADCLPAGISGLFQRGTGEPDVLRSITVEASWKRTPEYPYATAVHEFGHALDCYVTNFRPSAGTDAFRHQVSYSNDLNERYHISEYATQNTHEYFAEAFTADQLGKGDRLTTEDRKMLDSTYAASAAMIDAADIMAAAVYDPGPDIIEDAFGGSIVDEWADEQAKLREQRERAARTAEAVFNEEDHPRDDHGRFSSDGGGEGGQLTASDVVGVPQNVLEEVSYYQQGTDDFGSLEREQQDEIVAEARAYYESGIADTHTYDDWYAYNNYGDLDGQRMADAERFSNMVERGDWQPSGVVALDHLETPDTLHAQEMLDANLSNSVGYVAADVLTDLNDRIENMDPEDVMYAATVELRDALDAYQTNGDYDPINALLAPGIQSELIGLKSDGAVMFRDIGDVAGILHGDSGVFANEAMLGGEKGNWTGDARASDEAARIGVSYDTRPEDRPIYATAPAEPAEASAAVAFGDTLIELKPEVFDRATVALGDLLHVGASIPYREVAGLDPTNPDDAARLVTAAGTAAISEQFAGLVYEVTDDPMYVEEQPGYRYEDWPEVQIHGGVTLDDVASIGIPNPDEYQGTDSQFAAQVAQIGATIHGVDTYEYNDALYARGEMGL